MPFTLQTQTRKKLAPEQLEQLSYEIRIGATLQQICGQFAAMCNKHK